MNKEFFINEKNPYSFTLVMDVIYLCIDSLSNKENYYKKIIDERNVSAERTFAVKNLIYLRMVFGTKNNFFNLLLIDFLYAEMVLSS